MTDMHTRAPAQRIRHFGTTIFTEMTELTKHGGVINLGQGAPDGRGPSVVLDAAAAAVRAGHNQYPPASGVSCLRSAVAGQRATRYGTDYDADTEVTITNGATEAISAALLALCEPGDEVVLFEPYYDSYAAAISLAGGVRRTVPLRPLNDRFVFDEQQLRDSIGANTRFLLFNSPHNPTGKTFTPAELDVIAEVCQEHNLLVLTDEVYEYLTFDDARHRSIAFTDRHA
jgi:N-succinyldiaminopimelate aminotransferase